MTGGRFFFWLLSSLICVDVCVGFRTQSVAVEGKLMCGNQPAANVHVKLYDDDDGPDPDDLLDEDMTAEDGSFRLQGSAMELTPIDPEIRIYHDCNDHGKPCQREWVIRIPNKYIFSGVKPKRVMNLGTMNLEVELEQESQDCIH